MSGSLPEAVRRVRRRFQLIWLVPIVAAALAVYLAVVTLAERGPLITITFTTANGIAAQQTQVKHKAVALGIVEDVKLSRDMSHVLVHVRMNRQGASILTSHARFWVVRPRLNPGSISGLETLVSGAYIEVDPGAAGGDAERKFVGLEEPPGVRSDEPGRTYHLKASRLGSLGPGAPVFYRDVGVGEVLGYDLGNGLGPVTINVFVRSPYDRFVQPSTHFWNASGLSVTLGAQGLHAEVESLQALLSGGIAFETPRYDALGAPAANNAEFPLYDDKAAADAAGFRKTIPLVTYFRSSVAGLGRGSPVLIFGLQIGTVQDVRLLLNPGSGDMRARVAFELQPERVFSESEVSNQPAAPEVTRKLVEKGMRAVLETSNFITGQKAISMEFVPDAPPASVGTEGGSLLLPSQPGGFDNITGALSDVASKLRQIPFDEIGRNLNNLLQSASATIDGPELRQALLNLSTTLAQVRQLVQHADTGVAPLLQRLPKISAQLQEVTAKADAAFGENGYGSDSDFSHGLQHLLDEAGDATRSVRLLADFLDRHPEALLQGRSGKSGER